MSAHLVAAARNELRWYNQRILQLWMFTALAAWGAVGSPHPAPLMSYSNSVFFSVSTTLALFHVFLGAWASQQQGQVGNTQAQPTQMPKSCHLFHSIIIKCPQAHGFSRAICWGGKRSLSLKCLCSKAVVHRCAMLTSLQSEATSRILLLLYKRGNCFRRQLLELSSLVEYILWVWWLPNV